MYLQTHHFCNSCQVSEEKQQTFVASVLFKKPVMAVDTHVFRVGNRIGLTVARTPLSSELQLTKHIPEDLIHKAPSLAYSAWEVYLQIKGILYAAVAVFQISASTTRKTPD